MSREKVKILLVDNVNTVEIDVKNRLREMGYELDAIALSVNEVFESIDQSPPDLVLMDIHLEEQKKGIKTAKEIQEQFDIPVVFLSGETNYDMLREAAAADVYGFVSKPFDQADLFGSIELALYKHHKEQQMYRVGAKNAGRSGEKKVKKEFIFVRADYKLNKVNLKDILFIEALKDYVAIYTKEQVRTIHSTMKKMLQSLPGDDFVRIHKSYIVRLDKINYVKFPQLFVEDRGEALSIGNLYRKELFNRINII